MAASGYWTPSSRLVAVFAAEATVNGVTRWRLKPIEDIHFRFAQQAQTLLAQPSRMLEVTQ